MFSPQLVLERGDEQVLELHPCCTNVAHRPPTTNLQKHLERSHRCDGSVKPKLLTLSLTLNPWLEVEELRTQHRGLSEEYMLAIVINKGMTV